MNLQNHEIQGRELGNTLVQRLSGDPMFRRQILADANVALKKAGLLSLVEEAFRERAAVTLHGAQRENACPTCTCTLTVTL